MSDTVFGRQKKFQKNRSVEKNWLIIARETFACR